MIYFIIIDSTFKMNRSDILILDFQYLRGNKSQIFVKELAYTTADSTNISFFHFAPPFSSEELSPGAQRSNEYCSKHINMLNWNNGIINYLALKGILYSLSCYKIIYVLGEEKKRFLRQYLDNVETVPGNISFKSIQSYKHQCYIHEEDFKMCAFHHCKQIQHYLERIAIYE